MPSSRTLIADVWAGYAERVLPAEAGPSQTRETRRAFYAGADALLRAVMVALEPGSDATESDVTLMEGIDDELKAFARDVQAGRA